MVMERQEKGMGKQAANPAAFNFAEAGFGDRSDLDDDGREKRTGTLATASAHIITAVIGSGVLSLAWSIAQMGWVIGPAVLVAFSVITWFCSSLLADSYHSPDPVHGKRNYTYGDAVRANLGVAMSQSNKLLLCHLPLLLLASAAAAEAHHRISGNQFRWPRCVPELAHTMNVQPLGTTVHAAQGGTVDVDVAVDGGLFANTYKVHHGVQRSPGLNLNGTTFVAVPAGQAEPFAYGREHTDVLLAREDTRRTAGRDNGITAVLVPGRAEAETLACDCDHPVVPLDEWWNWHAQAAAGVAAVPSVLVGEPQLSLSYSRASFNSLLASGIRDGTRPDCSSAAPFTVAAGKTYHIVTSSGLLFDRVVHLSAVSLTLIALIRVVQGALDDQRRKHGGGRDAAVAMPLLILLVVASLPNAAMAARPLHGGGGVHDQTAAGPVAAEPVGLMPESKAAAGSACTNDPNTQDPHRCIHH